MFALFRCLGSGQHLKTKFGTGYLLEVKLMTSSSCDEEEQVEELNKFVLSQFPDASVMESFGERVIYKIPQDNIVSLRQTFTALEQGT